MIKTVLLFCYCDHYSYLFVFHQMPYHTTAAMLTTLTIRATTPPTVPPTMAGTLTPTMAGTSTGYRQKELTESQSFDWTGLHYTHTTNYAHAHT